MKNNTIKLLLLLILFISVWIAAAALGILVLWYIIINLIAIYIIFDYKIFNKFDIATGVVLGVLCIPSNVTMGLSVMLPYIASIMIFKDSNTKIYLFKNNKKNTFFITLILIFLIGGLLSCINVLLAMNGM